MTNEVTQKTTSNEQNVSSSNGLEPRLRFNEFIENWERYEAEEIFQNITDKNHPDDIVLTIQQGKGTLPRELSGRNILYDNTNTKNYKRVKFGDFIIHLRSFEGGLEIANEQGIVSPAYTILRHKKNIAFGFYKAYFRTNEFINHVLSKSVEGIRDGKQISYDAFKWLSIPYCKLEEQQKIADFLSLVDQRIEKQRQLVESLKKYKRGVIFKLFSKNNPNNQSFSLRELLHEKNDRNSLGLRVCSVAVNKGIIDQIEHLGRCFAASDTSKYRRVSYGDVVYTKSPTGDFPYGIVKQSKIHSDVCVSPLYGVYKTLNYEVGNLIHAYFELHQLANNYIRPLAQKGAKNTINITTSHFLDDIIYFPSNDKNRKNISNFLDKLTRCISIHEEKLRQNEKLKKGLLQKMFI